MGENWKYINVGGILMSFFGSGSRGLFGGGDFWRDRGIVPDHKRTHVLEREDRKQIEGTIKEISPEVGEVVGKLNNSLDAVENVREALELYDPYKLPGNIVRRLMTRTSDQYLEKADHLYVHRGVYSHHGLYLGNGQVIHYSEGRVRTDSLEVFSKGAGIEVIYSEMRYSADEVIRRAYSRLGESKYNLLFNNCEHFVNWCRNGD
jgi:hypothetical protein